MMNGFAEERGVALALSTGESTDSKQPPSVMANQLRTELIRILQTGDAKSDGAFTVAVATHIEKFVAAAREILMTEQLAHNDLASLMRMRGRPMGGLPYGAFSVGVDDNGYGLLPGSNNENFGVQAIRQVVDAVRTFGDSPVKLVEALAAAREHALTDVVAVLERKLGLTPAGSPSDAAAAPAGMPA